jgi:hypothetical protein
MAHSGNALMFRREQSERAAQELFKVTSVTKTPTETQEGDSQLALMLTGVISFPILVATPRFQKTDRREATFSVEGPIGG